jgi:hypothetical protein
MVKYYLILNLTTSPKTSAEHRVFVINARIDDGNFDAFACVPERASCIYTGDRVNRFFFALLLLLRAGFDGEWGVGEWSLRG